MFLLNASFYEKHRRVCLPWLLIATLMEMVITVKLTVQNSQFRCPKNSFISPKLSGLACSHMPHNRRGDPTQSCHSMTSWLLWLLNVHYCIYTVWDGLMAYFFFLESIFVVRLCLTVTNIFLDVSKAVRGEVYQSFNAWTWNILNNN